MRKELGGNIDAIKKEMETLAEEVRGLIITMPPLELLGFVYSHFLRTDSGVTSNTLQFILEYVHAVLATTKLEQNLKFDETSCARLFDSCRKLQEQSMFYALFSSINNNSDSHEKSLTEFHAKTSWVMLRGNRYQVLEEEFYKYVLAPHNEALLAEYKISSEDIAKGFQEISNATRLGYKKAIENIKAQFEYIQDLVSKNKLNFENAASLWKVTAPEAYESTNFSVQDMLYGGICNVSRHTSLPKQLLEDLACGSEEDADFFNPGDFCGTPYRTLPVRKKPLLKLEDDYYAIDPCSTRDYGYRALLFNLLKRNPNYKDKFKEIQKNMTESAFADILEKQLPNATVYQEVYYKDVDNRQWVENDTLILIDDVLLLIEAKSGAAATIASPELDFDRHLQSVQDLVVKAYEQCQRFFKYLDSSEEVPLFNLIDGKYIEIGKICRSNYRVMLPIGLTVESFSPFSTYCKELPQIEKLLGKHAFISMSIDDLFVLRKFLPTPGEFFHYMEVRQSVAGIKHSFLYDEFDHLGAYLQKNRIDLEILGQFRDGYNLTIWDGMSDIVDSYFEKENWEAEITPSQSFPKELSELLKVLNDGSEEGWLAVDSHIRNLDDIGRSSLAEQISLHCQTLNRHRSRYFFLGGHSFPLFVWIQRHNILIDWNPIRLKSSAAALAISSSNAIGIVIKVLPNGDFQSVLPFTIDAPKEKTASNAAVYDEAFKMNQSRIVNFNTDKKEVRKKNKIGRNEPCPCGSGIKYKKCHAV